MSEFKGICVDCGSPELYSNSEIRQPRMCVDCYAAMIGFTRVGDSFVDSDTLGDDHPIENRIGRIDKPSNSRELETLDKLENHISLNCKVEDV
ncbi:hypothetical protein Q5M79_06330 [Acinetobacter baumannii]|nr:hypothetical protein [Acinetobacter baumannii]